MKKFILGLLLSIALLDVSAAHIKGGFFTYQYLGPGTTNPTFLRYKIVLTVYMICGPSAGQYNNPINFTIFQGNTSTIYDNPSVSVRDSFNLHKLADEPCIAGDQRECYYTIVNYELNNYELPVTPDGFMITYQRCCRINSMDNIDVAVGSGTVGNTLGILVSRTKFTGLNDHPNKSPLFPTHNTFNCILSNFFSIL